MSSPFGKSLAFVKFNTRLETELRSYWHIVSSFEYTERWWQSLPTQNWPSRLTLNPGDNRKPFSQIDISPAEYISHAVASLRTLRRNTLVLAVTLLETYLLDILRRVVFLAPSVVSDSTLSIAASQIAVALEMDDFRCWFADHVASQTLRGRTHGEMLERVAKIAKAGLAKTKLYEWSRWLLVRNSIVHLDGDVSPELVKHWGSRFTSIGEPLALTDSDVMQVAACAQDIARILDSRIVATIILRADADLLIRELFVRIGEDHLAQRSSKILGARVSKSDVQRSVAVQRRENLPLCGFAFTAEMLQL